MSKTYRTNEDRQLRIDNRLYIDLLNHDQGNELFHDLNKKRSEVGQAGIRYGNHRRFKAKDKIRQRKADRRNLAKEIDLHCPQCDSCVWDKVNIDQALNKCWNCNLRFD